MTFDILEFPRHSVLLRRKARPVRDDEFGTEPLLAYVATLGQTMMEAGGLGLAATQVAEVPGGAPGGEAVAIFTLRVSEREWGAICNPEIVESGGQHVGEEACLSFASVGEQLAAPDAIILRGRDPHANLIEMPLEGLGARCAYHEERHLRGELMIDLMSSLRKGLFLKAVQKARRGR